MNSELLELLLEDEKDEEESFVWIVDLNITEGFQINKEQLKKEANFYAELFETIDQLENTDHALAPLYDHSLGRKYLSPLSTSEQKEVLEVAEKMLIDLLYHP